MKKSNIIIFLICSCIFSVACKKETTTAQNTQTATTVTDPDAAYLAPPETQPAIQKPITHNVDANIGGYLEALPYGYKKGGTKKYPLMIFLHGQGELGNGTTDLYKVADNGVPKLLAAKTFPPNFVVNDHNFSFIVLTPQFKAWPQATDINRMINYAISKYHIDTTRMYVSGLSMGGGGAWDYTFVYGKRLAAIVPIAGASWPTPEKGLAIAQDSVGVWAFHNADDPTVPPIYSEDYVMYINEDNPKRPARLTLWPTGGHDAWIKATDPSYTEHGKNMYEWMLTFRKNNAK